MKEFEEYRRNLMQKRQSVVFLTTTPLYLSFSILDKISAPDHWVQFLWIRIFSCLLMGILAVLFKFAKEFTGRNVVTLSHVVTTTLGVGIGYMTHVTGGFASPYYAGLNWVALGSLSFLPWRVRDRATTIISIYGALLIMEIASSNHPFNQTAILPMTFMAGTCLLSILNNVLSLRSLKEEFKLRSTLEDLIRNKDQIIEAKSNESANLKRLAKQFSPAVIQAIESQTISLNERSRRKVAIIFLDVVGSTNRSNHLDHDDYQKVLDQFFGMAISILLKKNITVANFMGDGLMAIANAPYKTPDFESVAFLAALEIIEETDRRKKHFQEYWRGEFAIRIGISTGYATVGFFPNTDFGVYTAIGESVNLSSRLCSAAESSSIATTKAIISAVSGLNETYNIKRGGSIGQLKGFSGHELEYYIATPKVLEAKAEQEDRCPLCSHSLIASDLGDCIMLKCESCKYNDIQDKPGIDTGKVAA